jgi:hypothetical protein
MWAWQITASAVDGEAIRSKEFSARHRFDDRTGRRDTVLHLDRRAEIKLGEMPQVAFVSL